jgi:PucR-like helix-turn-helix protein
MATLESAVRDIEDRARADDMQHRLARVVASGDGVDGMLAALSAELGVEVEHVAPGHDLAPDGDELHYPVVAAAEPLGVLRVRGAEALTAGRASVLAVAAHFVGVELVKARAVLEATWAFEGELLQELIDAGDEPDARLRARAARAGVDTIRPWTHLALEAVGAQAEVLLAAARRPTHGGARALACDAGDTILVALGTDDDADVDCAIAHLTRVTAGAGGVLRAGASSPTPDFAVGSRQASAALVLARQAGAPSTVKSDALGSLRFLLAAPDTAEIASLVVAHLAPLAEHDAARDSRLLQTLETFLSEGGNRPRTAARCHIHISTLKYRLGQISRLLGYSLSDAHVRFELMLAFELHHLLQLLGRDVLATSN